MMPVNESFKSRDFIGGNVDKGLIVKLELASGESIAQALLEVEPLLHLCVHLGLKKTDRSAPIGLGAVQGKIGIANSLVGRRTAVLPDGDANARAYHRLVAVDLVGLAQAGDNAMCQRRGLGRVRETHLHNGKFITAHPRNGVSTAHYRAETVRCHLQQLVAGWMPERVVDDLEAVEIEQVDGHDVIAFGAG